MLLFQVPQYRPIVAGFNQTENIFLNDIRVEGFG